MKESNCPILVRVYISLTEKEPGGYRQEANSDPVAKWEDDPSAEGKWLCVDFDS